MPFQPGNQEAKKGTKAKPFRDALRLQIAAAGEDGKKLRDIAEKLLDLALAGDLQAIKEIADRTDGKVPQGVIGGDDDDPGIKVEHVQRVIVDPNSNSSGSAPAT